MFTDIEGSTRLVQQLGDEYGDLLSALRQLLRDAVFSHGGQEIDCRADELFAVFQRARDGLEAAVSVQEALASHVWPDGVAVSVRIGLHTGEPAIYGDFYLGLDVNRAARICAAAHGGQILLSRTTRDLIEDRVQLRDLGAYSLAGLASPEQLFQPVVTGLRSNFPALGANRTDPRRPRTQVRFPSRKGASPTFADAARHARQLLPAVTAELRRPLAQLGADLLTAHRAAGGAADFLAQIDRKRLERRLAGQAEQALALPQAAKEVERLDRGIAAVNTLASCMQALDELVLELPDALSSDITASQIASLQRRTTGATGALDEAVTRAAAALDPASYKLTRTRHRGIYRSGHRYVVPFTDELGRERRREFETLSEASGFRTAIRQAEKAQTDLEKRIYGFGGWGP